MTFGLKNTWPTYKRLTKKVSMDQIRRNLEFYIDDMVTKTLINSDHYVDLMEVFGQLRKYKIKLNQEKCAF